MDGAGYPWRYELKKMQMKSHRDKLVLIFILTIIFFTDGCDGISDKKYHPSEQSEPKYSYHFLQFLDGNDKLLFFQYNQRNFQTKSIFIYEVPTHRLYRPLTMNGADYPRIPRFSRDKKRIAFVSDKDGGRNIYVMNADGSDVRQLTFITGNSRKDSKVNLDVQTNEGPSFSPDGSRIIFKRSHTLGWVTKTPIRWDVYEIDIKTGKESKLTNIASSLMSDPFYFSDGNRFIFHSDKADEGEGVYIADNKRNTLNKISTGGWWIPGPRISWNDKIVFMGGLHLQHPDHDLFIYENGIIKRLNWIQRGVHVTNLAISLDGSKVLFESEAPIDSSKFVRSLWIGNADGTELQEINIPWEHLKESKLD